MDKKKGEKIIRHNFKEYLEHAERAFQQKKWSIAVTLFGRAASTAIDLYTLLRIGTISSSLAPEFKVADFPLLHDNNDELNKKAAEILRNLALKIKKMSEQEKE